MIVSLLFYKGRANLPASSRILGKLFLRPAVKCEQEGRSRTEGKLAVKMRRFTDMPVEGAVISPWGRG